jgi:DegV family protein with EDD domain
VVVCDSGGDIPAAEVDRLGIHIVPVRLSFGDQEYLDGISLTPERFYEMLAEAQEAPRTSQPPAQDFNRAYSLLTSHGYRVISVGLSARLSGTTGAALQAASRFGDGEVTVIDSRNATCGQGLLAIMAAEAAASGMGSEEIEVLLKELIPATRVLAVCDDLRFAVQGGRLPAWIKRLANLLRINPVLSAGAEGQLRLAGFIRGVRADVDALARLANRKMGSGVQRILISHANAPEAARRLRASLLRMRGQVHSCHITEAGPALGVHFGPGTLIVGFCPNPDSLD